MRSFLIATFVATFGLSASAEEKSDLAANMKDAKVSLERGIAASKAKGTPISAKYEVENGKLQLSVYTAKGDAFSEVIVDHKTGKVARRNRSPAATTSPLPSLKTKPSARPRLRCKPPCPRP